MSAVGWMWHDTQVDGIFDSDPAKNPDAKKYNQLSYRQCTDDSLRVMDGERKSFCRHLRILQQPLNSATLQFGLQITQLPPAHPPVNVL